MENFIIVLCGFVVSRVLTIVMKNYSCRWEILNNDQIIRGKMLIGKYSLLFMQTLLLFIYLLILHNIGYTLESLYYCLFTTALLLLSIIDFIIYEIPIQINLFIGALGIIKVLTDLDHLLSYLIGFFCVSGFLYIIYIITKGKGIGGGDIKLMAVSGLILGFPNIIVAFLLACILGSIIHTIRCKVSKANHVLAFGPYLSVGLFLSMLYGDQIISWYLSLY